MAVKKLFIFEYVTILLAILMLVFCLLNWMVPALIALIGTLVFLFYGNRLSGIHNPLSRTEKQSIRRLRKKRPYKLLKTICMGLILVGVVSFILDRIELSYISLALATAISAFTIVLIVRRNESCFTI